ncbi:MAG: hypothetical protein AAB227_08220 [Pseudomonadota bacterium]
MRTRIFLTIAMTALAVACSKPKSEAAPAAEPAAAAPTAETSPVELPMPAEPKFDASGAPAGVYKSDPGHA